MHIKRADLETCGSVTGVAVVIDVIRAFTTAAYAFAAGASDIVPVGTILALCTGVDRFDFVMLVERRNGRLVMPAQPPCSDPTCS